MITISWHFLVLIASIVGLWILAFTRDDSGTYITDRDIGVLISLFLAIILILLYGEMFWW